MSKKITFTVLFTAIMCASCFIQIPFIGGVPIVLQDMIAILSGILLGPIYGLLCVLLFIILGCLGLPVFSGKAGIQIILQSPTGGFIIGYLIAAFIVGLFTFFTHRNNNKIFNTTIISLASILGIVIIFTFGMIRFWQIFPSKAFSEIKTIILIPFLPGTIVKLFMMVPLAIKLQPTIKNYLE